MVSMKNAIILFICLALSFNLDSRVCAKTKAKDAEKAKKAMLANPAIKHIDANTTKYDKIQKQIWSYAEVGFHEFKSSALLQQTLREGGFSVQSGMADMPTAFIAEYGSGKPVIGILAEFDALPGLSQDTVSRRKVLNEGQPGHGCGHNLICTGSVAAALSLKEWIDKTGTSCTIRLFGTPAEEGGSGKAYMARAGLFNGVDAMLDWHPGQKQKVYVNPWLDRVSMDVRFYGKPAHASAHPEDGRSALDAAEAFTHMLNMMREHVPEACAISYIYSNGGAAENVVPDFASIDLGARAPSQAQLKDLLAWIRQAAEGAALGTQTRVELEVISSSMSKLHNRTLATLLQEKLELVGLPQWDEREIAFAREIYETQSKARPFENIYSILPLEPEMAHGTSSSSDVGDVTWLVPDGGFETQTFIPSTSGHSWQNVAVAGSTIGTKGLIVAAKVIALAAIDLIENPALLQKAQDEFNSRRGPDFKYEPLIGDRLPPYDYQLK
jgi:aminobenzoyl-glutamate utilization protein B